MKYWINFQVALPNEETVYWCKLFTVPNPNTVQHILKVGITRHSFLLMNLIYMCAVNMCVFVYLYVCG